jgi:hypothetical protein
MESWQAFPFQWLLAKPGGVGVSTSTLGSSVVGTLAPCTVSHAAASWVFLKATAVGNSMTL